MEKYEIYKRLPIGIQNIIFSVYGGIYRRRRYSKHFHTSLEKLLTMEYRSRDEIINYQNAKLKEIVKHAYQTVPFYHNLYKSVDVHPDMIRSVEDIKLLPKINKEQVLKHSNEMVSTRYTLNKLSKHLTSGTTGTPLKIYFLPEALSYQWAIWWRHRKRFGLSIDDPFLMFGARVPVDPGQTQPPYWRDDYYNKRTYLSSNFLSQKFFHEITSMMGSRVFKYYAGYPSAIALVSQFILDNDIRLKKLPKVISCGSDALLPVFKVSMEKAFLAKVTEVYGMAEFAGNYSKCEHGRFHLDYECCASELLKIPNSSMREIIFTGWGNPAMPFIRYSTGDYATEGDTESCPCGRESPIIMGVDGRTEDYIVTRDNRKIIGMNQVLEYGYGAKEIQLFQKERGTIEVRIVKNSNFSPETEKMLEKELRKRVGRDFNIKFLIVPSIMRTKSGKYRAVINEVQDESDASIQLKTAISQ